MNPSSRLVQTIRILIDDSLKTRHASARRLLREDACARTLEFVADMSSRDVLTAQRMAKEALRGFER